MILTKKDIGRWVWLSGGIFPVCISDVKGTRVRVIWSDFSGANKWRYKSEVKLYATKSQVKKELKDSLKQILGQWPGNIN